MDFAGADVGMDVPHREALGQGFGLAAPEDGALLLFEGAKVEVRNPAKAAS